KGYQYAKEDLGRVFSERKLNNIYVLEKEISDMNEKLLNDISNAFKMDVENAESLDDLSLTCRFLFESNQYKVKANARSTLYRAYNYGKVLAYIDAGEDKIMVQPESDCNECKEKSKESISLKIKSEVDEQLLFYRIPPWHYNCECEILRR